MGSRKLKKKITSLLLESEWPEIKEHYSGYKDIDLVNALFPTLCSTREVCKWHAVSSFGYVVARMGGDDLESARIVMRRLMWSLNDESGGIGWGAPEAMGEIMTQSSTLFSEYAHMLISYMQEDGPEMFQDGNSLELPALQQGVLWGVGRLLYVRQQEMLERGVVKSISSYLDSPDEIVQGLACWCLGMCRQPELIQRISLLTEKTATFNLYLDGKLEKVSVATLAGRAVAQLQSLARNLSHEA